LILDIILPWIRRSAIHEAAIVVDQTVDELGRCHYLAFTLRASMFLVFEWIEEICV
jgi:hypothetical protein